jgi:hypothetical protein
MPDSLGKHNARDPQTVSELIRLWPDSVMYEMTRTQTMAGCLREEPMAMTETVAPRANFAEWNRRHGDFIQNQTA